MNKIVIGFFALASITASAQIENFKSTNFCQMRCSKSVLYPKYVNDVEKVEVIVEGEKRYSVEYRTIDSVFYTTEVNLPAGIYDANDERLIKIPKDEIVCAVFFRSLGHNADIVDKIVSESVTRNRQTTNGAVNGGDNYYIVSKTNRGSYIMIGLYDKEPYFISENDTKLIVQEKLNHLKDNGSCK